MQIAKMFASLGFKVDNSGLNQFTASMKTVRADMAMLARNAGALKRNLNDVSSAVKNLNSHLNIKKADSRLSDTYIKLRDAIKSSEKALKSVADNQPRITKAMGKINASVIKGANEWERYSKSVERTKMLLTQSNNELKSLRTNSNLHVRQPIHRNHIGVVTRDDRQPSQRQATTPKRNGVISGMVDLMRASLPATLLGGGLGAVGYVGKEVIQRGREQQQMERAMQFATKDMGDFRDSLEYVRKEALRLGMSSATLGKTFATVAGATEGKMSRPELKKMFTDMNEYYTAVHATSRDKDLMNLAVQQMFSIGKIQGQEIGQLTGTGLITRAQLNKAIMQVYKLKDTSQIESMQKAGKLDPQKVLTQLFGNLAGRAHSTGAFDAAMQSSVTKQGQLSEQFNQLSQKIMDGGLDKMLATLIGLLSKLVDNISWVVDGLKGFKKAMDDLTAGNSTWVAVAVVVLGLLTRNRKAIVSGARSIKSMRTMWVALTKFMSGSVARVFKFIGGRIFWIIGAIQALSWIGNQYSKQLSGKYSWLSVFSVYIDIAISKLTIFKNTLIGTYLEAKMLATSPFDYISQQVDIFKGNVNKEFFGDVRKDAYKYLPISKTYNQGVKSDVIEKSKTFQGVPFQAPLKVPEVKNTQYGKMFEKDQTRAPIQLKIDLYTDGQKTNSLGRLLTSDMDYVTM